LQLTIYRGVSTLIAPPVVSLTLWSSQVWEQWCETRTYCYCNGY